MIVVGIVSSKCPTISSKRKERKKENQSIIPKVMESKAAPIA